MSKQADNEPWPELVSVECKGCGRCVPACPHGLLSMSKTANARGYHIARFQGGGCVGCANCYYACPEPYAIRIHIPEKDTRHESE